MSEDQQPLDKKKPKKRRRRWPWVVGGIFALPFIINPEYFFGLLYVNILCLQTGDKVYQTYEPGPITVLDKTARGCSITCEELLLSRNVTLYGFVTDEGLQTFGVGPTRTSDCLEPFPIRVVFQ